RISTSAAWPPAPTHRIIAVPSAQWWGEVSPRCQFVLMTVVPGADALQTTDDRPHHPSLRADCGGAHLPGPSTGVSFGLDLLRALLKINFWRKPQRNVRAELR